MCKLFRLNICDFFRIQNVLGQFCIWNCKTILEKDLHIHFFRLECLMSQTANSQTLLHEVKLQDFTHFNKAFNNVRFNLQILSFENSMISNCDYI